MLALALADDAEIQRSRVQLLGQLAAVAAAQLHLNAGVAVVKFANNSGQPPVIGAVGRANHDRAHIQPANPGSGLGAGFPAA